MFACCVGGGSQLAIHLIVVSQGQQSPVYLCMGKLKHLGGSLLSFNLKSSKKSSCISLRNGDFYVFNILTVSIAFQISQVWVIAGSRKIQHALINALIYFYKSTVLICRCKDKMPDAKRSFFLLTSPSTVAFTPRSIN